MGRVREKGAPAYGQQRSAAAHAGIHQCRAAPERGEESRTGPSGAAGEKRTAPGGPRHPYDAGRLPADRGEDGAHRAVRRTDGRGAGPALPGGLHTAHRLQDGADGRQRQRENDAAARSARRALAGNAVSRRDPLQQRRPGRRIRPGPRRDPLARRHCDGQRHGRFLADRVDGPDRSGAPGSARRGRVQAGARSLRRGAGQACPGEAAALGCQRAPAR